MAATFKFELVSPERILLSVDADEVLMPGAEGDFTVLAGHAPFISTLRPGVLEVKAQGTTQRIYVKSGFADVGQEQATVLAADAVEVAELSGSRLAATIEAAETALAEAKDDESRRFANEALVQLKALGAPAGGKGH